MSKKRSGKIHIDKDMCKGCGICMYFCPTDSLEMREFKVAIKNEESCTACMMCELRCPDFAIDVVVVKEASNE